MHTEKEIVTTAYSKLTPLAIIPFLNRRRYNVEFEYPDGKNEGRHSSVNVQVSNEEIEAFKVTPKIDQPEGSLQLAARDIVKAYSQVDLSHYDEPNREDPRWRSARSELEVFTPWVPRSSLDRVAQKIVIALENSNQ